MRAWPLLVALLSLTGCPEKKRAEAPAPVAHAPAPATPVTLPPSDAGPPAGDDDDLTLRVVATDGDALLADADGTRLRVELGSPAQLSVEDAAAGARFVQVAAKWLQQPVPPSTHQSPIVPLTFEAMDMGVEQEESGPWQYYKAFFSHGAEYAELFVNVSADHRWVRLRPKDSEYAGPLLEMMADTLRDGPPPPRTRAVDPTLSSEKPLFALAPTPAVSEVTRAVCFDEGLALLRPAASGTKVFFAAWGGHPPSLAYSLSGFVEQVANGPVGSTAVAAVRVSGSRGVTSSGDAMQLWRLGPRQASPLETRPAVKLTAFDSLVGSPDGARVGFVEGKQAVMVTVRDGKVETKPLAGDYLAAWGWDEQGLVAKVLLSEEWVHPGGQRTQEAAWHSLDGRFTVTREPGKALLVAEGKQPPRRYPLKLRSDLRALASWGTAAPAALGPHGFVIGGAQPVVLDLASLTARPLVEKGQLVCATRDGQHAVFATGEGAAERFAEGVLVPP